MPPALDDKVLTDWSALAVRALAEAGRLLKEERYLEAARKGAHFLLLRMRQGGLLRHAWREGHLGEEAYVADQAFAALALLELYAATAEWPYLEEARRLAEAGLALLGEGRLPLPAKALEEGAIPSGESALAEALVRLGGIFGPEYYEKAQALLEREAHFLARHPEALPGFLLAHRLLQEGSELAVPLPSPFLREAQALYLPLTQLVLGPAGALPALEGKEPGLLYPCRRGACRLPTDRLEEALKALKAP